MKRKPTELPQHQNPTIEKLKAALADLGECWMYRNELCTHYGLNSSKLGQYKHAFEGHFFVFGQRQIWSGSKETIEHLKEQTNGR